jgi:hypothetical protein
MDKDQVQTGHPRCRFFELPREVRDLIYECIWDLVRADRTALITHRYKAIRLHIPLTDSFRRFPRRKSTIGLPGYIFHNRQFNREALDQLLLAVTVDAILSPGCFVPRGIALVVPYVRRLTVYAATKRSSHTGCSIPDLHLLKEGFRGGNKLHHLRIVLRSDTRNRRNWNRGVKSLKTDLSCLEGLPGILGIFEVQYDSHGLACKPPYVEILEQACAVARVEFERMGSLLVKGEKTFEAVERTIGGRWVWLFRMKKV